MISPDTTHHRRLTYEKIAETEIESCPVLRAEFPDTGSWAHLVLDRTGDKSLLRLTHVESKLTGDMRHILDDVTEQLGIFDIRVMVPLDGIDNRTPIAERLHGFERTTETLPGPNGPETVEVLAGRWMPRDDA